MFFVVNDPLNTSNTAALNMLDPFNTLLDDAQGCWATWNQIWLAQASFPNIVQQQGP